jgi:low affinity Fe/Cu permease
MNKLFTQAACLTAEMIGKPITFVINVAIILLWAVSGPLFQFSDTWQLVVNTGTTVFTYLMLFLLQHTQNRDGKALQTKLDEILRAIPQADDGLRGIEKDPRA